MVPGSDRIAAKPYQSRRKPCGSGCDLLNAPLKTAVRVKKSHMRARVDRRVAQIDSLIAQIEMAARTNGMSLAKCETVGGNYF